MSLPEHIKHALVDMGAASPLAIAAGKIATVVEKCRVIGYDALSHTAMVLRLGGGGATPLRVRVNTEGQGAQPGTGTATAQTNNQEVSVLFTHTGGLYNDGLVIGSAYTPRDQQAPAYAPFQQSGTGRVVVDGKADGTFSNADHTDWVNGVRSTTVIGAHNLDVRNNADAVVGGSNMPRAEEQMRLAAELLSQAAEVFNLRSSA